MKAIDTLKLLIETKEQSESFKDMTLYELLEGEYDVLEAYKLIRMNADTLQSILKDKDFVSLVENEVSKYGNKAEVNECVYEVRGRATYDYSVCNDSEYNELVKKQNELKEKIKAREAFLKSINADMDIANADTGEQLTPPAKKTTTSIYFKIK